MFISDRLARTLIQGAFIKHTITCRFDRQTLRPPMFDLSPQLRVFRHNGGKDRLMLHYSRRRYRL